MHHLSKIILLVSILPVCITFSCKSPLNGNVQSIDQDKALETIVFGSCNRQDLAQPMWPFIVAEQADLWIWLGDNIYGDTNDMKVMKAKYGLQLENPGYQQLLQTSPIIGIWDDHDYGVNDGGKGFPKKKESKTLMLDFLGVSAKAPVRQREGAYQAYTVGPAGKKVKIILLDARYFRDVLENNPTKNPRYFVNKDGDILGEAQWQWLEKELKNSDAQINLIASGIQFIPEEHAFEKWANFPKAHQRIMDLIATTKPAKTILLSGDRHVAEISKRQIDGLNYPLYEVTSSGLTHSYEKAGDEPNRFRVSPLIGQKNYGLLKIDWSEKTPKVEAVVKGLDNTVFIKLALD